MKNILLFNPEHIQKDCLKNLIDIYTCYKLILEYNLRHDFYDAVIYDKLANYLLDYLGSTYSHRVVDAILKELGNINKLHFIKDITYTYIKELDVEIEKIQVKIDTNS